MKTDFTFDAQALDTQELESVSGGNFTSVADGYPTQGFHIQWSPAILPKDVKTGVAKPNGWTWSWIN